MSCVSPITISTKTTQKLFKLGLLPTSSIQVSCGRCLNCRIVKQSQLSYLCGREMLEQYKKGNGNSFVTLTYDDNHIPRTKDGRITLRKSDVQKFMKRLRRNLEYHYGSKTFSFRYLCCGEYGDSFGRCHYHICFFGLSTEIIKKISRKVWKFGLCDIGVLTSGGVRYVCKYLTKQLPSPKVEALRDGFNVENPFITHSFGIGKEWINKNIDKIANDDFQFNINGKRYFYPKYILRYVSLKTGKDYRKIISQEMNKKDYREWKRDKPDILTLDNYREFKSNLTLETNIRVLRARGIPVEPFEVSKTRCYKPYHSIDRKYISNLASKALLVDVPF